MSESNSVVAVYATHEGAEQGVKELQRAGLDRKSSSIIGKDTHTGEQVVGYCNNCDRMKYWGKTGAFWGGFWGLLFGSAFFVIPGIGPVLIAGPLISSIIGALKGAVVIGGLSAIDAGLVGMGIPKDSVVEYELAVKTDKYLFMVSGSMAEVDKARGILDSTHPDITTIHSNERIGAAAR